MIDQSFALKELLLADIQGGRWRPGERLPTERQLCVDHEVGRAAVRRALAEIKEMGLITQTVGSGTYVSRPTTSPNRDPVLSPATLMEARLILEPALVPLIIRHATSADFATLEAYCNAGDQASTLEAFEKIDGEFHLHLACATHNEFLLKTFQQLSQARNTAEWGSLKRRSATAERRILYGQQHRALLGYLRDRDTALARETLTSHLLGVASNMFD